MQPQGSPFDRVIAVCVSVLLFLVSGNCSSSGPGQLKQDEQRTVDNRPGKEQKTPKRVVKTLVQRSVALYITQPVPESTYTCSSSLLGSDLCPSHKKRIMTMYRNIDIRQLVKETFMEVIEQHNKESRDQCKKEKDTDEERTGKLIEYTVEHVENLHSKKPHSDCDFDNGEAPYDFTGDPQNRVRSDYLLELQIEEWGFVFLQGIPHLVFHFNGYWYNTGPGNCFGNFSVHDDYRFGRCGPCMTIGELTEKQVRKLINAVMYNNIKRNM